MAGFGAFLLLAALYCACTGDWGGAAACFFIGMGLIGVRADRGPAQYRPRRAYCAVCGGHHLATEDHAW